MNAPSIYMFANSFRFQMASDRWLSRQKIDPDRNGVHHHYAIHNEICTVSVWFESDVAEALFNASEDRGLAEWAAADAMQDQNKSAA